MLGVPSRYVHSHYNFCAKDDLEALRSWRPRSSGGWTRNASATSCARIYCREAEKMERPIIGIMGNTYMTQPGLFDSIERLIRTAAMWMRS